MANEAAVVSDLSHEELIERCVEHEQPALRELYERTAAQLFGVLIRILQSEDLAQEALQDVFVRIWQRADSYRPARGSALTWMMSIARYRALDIRRSRSHELTIGEAMDDLPADESAPEVDLLTTVQRDAEATQLKDCLDELTLMQRNSVSLAYLSGLTHPEIAIVLGAPLGTVKSWVRRGLASLKECVER